MIGSTNEPYVQGLVDESVRSGNSSTKVVVLDQVGECVRTGIIDRHFRTEALSGFRPDDLAH
jgi:hypothetical protein